MLYMMQHGAVSLGVGSGLSGLQAYEASGPGKKQ